MTPAAVVWPSVNNTVRSIAKRSTQIYAINDFTEQSHSITIFTRLVSILFPMIISIYPIQLPFISPFKTLCAIWYYIVIDGIQSNYWGLFNNVMFTMSEIYKNYNQLYCITCILVTEYKCSRIDVFRGTFSTGLLHILQTNGLKSWCSQHSPYIHHVYCLYKCKPERCIMIRNKIIMWIKYYISMFANGIWYMHCGHVGSSLYTHCDHGGSSLYTHCGHGVSSLYTHCGHGASSLYTHCGHGVSSFYTHIGHGGSWLYTHCGHGLSLFYTHCGHGRSSLYTHCDHVGSSLYTHCG